MRPAWPHHHLTAACLVLASLAAPGLAAPAELKFADAKASRAEYDRAVAPFFAKHCNACHDEKNPRGDLVLAKLGPDMKAGTSAGRWALLLGKLSAGEMPPKGKPRPAKAELDAVVAWARAEMKRAGKHSARRALVANGNSVPHELLFGPGPAAPLDVPPRIRRLSTEIYNAFAAGAGKGFADLLGSPFSPDGKSTFKDMGAPRVDEPVTAQLLRNAVLLVERQTNHKVEGGKVVGLLHSRRELLPLVDPAVPLTRALMETGIRHEFRLALGRGPTDKELARFVALMEKTVKGAGRVSGVRYSLAAVFLLPEAVFRFEVGGKPDAKGRARLAPREIATGLAFALTDRRPEPWLLDAADRGKLDGKEGVAEAVRKMLDDRRLQKPRIMRFFREYFDYEKAVDVFKDGKDGPEHDARVLVEDTDRLVEYVLERDRDVLHELLTTNKSFVAYKTAAQTKKKRIQELAKFEANRKKDPKKFARKKPPKVGKSVYEAYNLPDFPDVQPVELPKGQRAGVLTQPAWLVAHSTSFDNHAIHRGKWVRERLLGGVVPDVPITVDAQLPDRPDQTLRQRMKVTQQAYCWKCHTMMNDVGLPFEIYDHFGRFRTKEVVQDPEATKKNVDKKGKPLGPVTREVPVDAAGLIAHAGKGGPEVKVQGAVAMLHVLARSELVEQVFVRHAFRYWMGRNETPGDGQSLREAHKAYKASGGSMKALIVALLTSDSFLYRVPSRTRRTP